MIAGLFCSLLSLYPVESMSVPLDLDLDLDSES